jgi:hypothetical protein
MSFISPSTLNKAEKKVKRSQYQRLHGFFKRYAMLKKLGVFIPGQLILWLALKFLLMLTKKPVDFCLHPVLLKQVQAKRLTLVVHPNQIQNFLLDWITLNGQDIHIADYFFGGGDWQSIIRLNQKSTVVNELNEMVDLNWDYKQSRVYAQYIARMQNGQFKSRQQVILDTIEKIDDYFERFHRLFLSISNYGYLTIDQLARLKKMEVDQEIGVAINAHGELIKLPGGQHRFAIARHLNIKIPVQVRLVHVDFIKSHQIKTPADLFAIVDQYRHL